MKLLKILKNHKKGFNTVNNADSMHQRSSAARAGTLPKTNKQKGGKEIAKMLDFDKERGKSIQDVNPLKVMDIVRQMWGEDPYYDPEDEADDE